MDERAFNVTQTPTFLKNHPGRSPNHQNQAVETSNCDLQLIPQQGSTAPSQFLSRSQVFQGVGEPALSKPTQTEPQTTENKRSKTQIGAFSLCLCGFEQHFTLCLCGFGKPSFPVYAVAAFASGANQSPAHRKRKVKTSHCDLPLRLLRRAWSTLSKPLKSS